MSPNPPIPNQDSTQWSMNSQPQQPQQAPQPQQQAPQQPYQAQPQQPYQAQPQQPYQAQPQQPYQQPYQAQPQQPYQQPQQPYQQPYQQYQQPYQGQMQYPAPAQPTAQPIPFNEWIASLKVCLAQRLIDYKGRSRRSEVLPMMIFFTALNLIGYLIFMLAMNNTAGVVLQWLLVGLTIVPMTSAMARRLHDIGKSGWMQLLPFAVVVFTFYIMYFIASVSNSMQSLEGFRWMWHISLVLGYGILGYLFSLDSEPRPNKWGNCPKQIVV